MNSLTTHIINFATGYENAFNNRVTSIESDNQTISIRFRINANKAFYSLDTVNVFANATYNVSNGKMNILTENSVGSRKYNSYVKYECEQLIKVFVSEAQKMLDVEIREDNRNAYDRCHIELLSLIDQTNPTHKNLCYGYINQILDLYQNGALAHEMESKLIEVKREMLSDVRLFPKVESNKDYKTIWCKLENGSYVIIRTRPNECAERLALEWTEACSYNRQYIAFPEGFNPNHDVQIIEEESSITEPSNECIEFSVITEPNSLQLDLQHFASIPTTRKLYESNYDSVKIITTSGEHIARIHPSDENEYQHKIFYSSDDSFSINDTDIISVTSIYKKVIMEEHGRVYKRGIGKGLSLSYTIETTKSDIEVESVNYSNIHKIECNSIQETIERLNRMQQNGYHNINIQTNVNYKNDSILTDTTECNIELDINTQYMNDMKTDNRQQREYIRQLEEELSNYKEFVSHYKAEKTFELFKENKNNKQVS